MQLNVLRSTNERGENEMMKLIRYNAADLAWKAGDNEVEDPTPVEPEVPVEPEDEEEPVAEEPEEDLF
jgi:hypothetical protein